MMLLAGHPTWVQFLVVQLLGFAFLVFVMAKWVVPPLGAALRKRSRDVEESFARIEREGAELEAKVKEAGARLANVQREIDARLRAAVDEGTRARDGLVADAAAQTAADASKAQVEVRIERDKAVLELRQEVSVLTLRAAEALVERLMDEREHGRLVDRYLAELEEAARRS